MITLQTIQSGRLDEQLLKLYPGNQIITQQKRYAELAENFTKAFHRDEFEIYSIPGRTEIIGNHTDHNLGKVIASAIDLDIVAAAAKNDSGKVCVKSEGFGTDEFDINDLSINPSEHYTSKSLLKGVMAKLQQLGYNIGGFNVYTQSNVLKGSGLSSSAAFEVMIGYVISQLFNNGSIDPVTLAKTAQYAENTYFGKPCGLMDQMACSLGGLVQIDFAQPDNPEFKRIETDIFNYGYSLCIVDTGGSHEDLNEDYAYIRSEMQAVAHHFSADVLRSCSPDKVFSEIKSLRDEAGDRAILRAIHYFGENERVEQAFEAIKSGNVSNFFEIIKASGISSWTLNQNVATYHNPREQGIALALAAAQMLLGGRGASRVHGGGFAGTIQCFVPNDIVESFKVKMEGIFGLGRCHLLQLRKYGGFKFEL